MICKKKWARIGIYVNQPEICCLFGIWNVCIPKKKTKKKNRLFSILCLKFAFVSTHKAYGNERTNWYFFFFLNEMINGARSKAFPTNEICRWLNHTTTHPQHKMSNVWEGICLHQVIACVFTVWGTLFTFSAQKFSEHWFNLPIALIRSHLAAHCIKNYFKRLICNWIRNWIHNWYFNEFACRVHFFFRKIYKISWALFFKQSKAFFKKHKNVNEEKKTHSILTSINQVSLRSFIVIYLCNRINHSTKSQIIHYIFSISIFYYMHNEHFVWCCFCFCWLIIYS